jgi:hypothetical protein
MLDMLEIAGKYRLLSKRIFSILINSMPDEEANSTITWLNSAIPGNQKTIVNMIQVGQYYGIWDSLNETEAHSYN